MRRILLQLLFILVLGFSALANELTLSDTIIASRNELAALLKSNDYAKKVDFLNQLYSPAHSGGLKSYAENILLDSIVTYAWSDESQKVEKTFLYICSFENEGKSVLVSIFLWDTSENEWIVGDENYYEFDANGRIEQIEFQEYVSPEYRLYTRIDYEYENDLLAFESRYDRIDEIETWDEVLQLEYQYNTDNSLKFVSLNEWDFYENEWVSNAYRTFTYDSIGNLQIETGFDYDIFTQESEKKFELRYTYDDNNNLLEITEYVPGWVEGVFVPEWLQTNVFDTFSNIESETFYNWSYDADGWVGNVKRLYSDKIEGEKLHETSSYLWSTESKKWEGSEKLEYLTAHNYNTSAIQNWDFLKIYIPVYSFDDLVCDRLEASSYENDTWQNLGWTNYYFSDETLVGINDKEQFTTRVYPNPVVDMLNVEINNFKDSKCIIRNLNGQILYQSNFQDGIQINTSNFKPGFYIVEIYSGKQKLYVNKIIKR